MSQIQSQTSPPPSAVTVAHLLAWMDRFAPLDLAESWDNVGLLLGDPAAPVERVMTCLTVTARTAAEAIDQRAEAIISHHPILFRGTKSLRADSPETGFVLDLARAGVAVLSPHTRFDNCAGGINDGLARRFELTEVAPLRPRPAAEWFKLVVFAPVPERRAILEAAFAAGAGRLGEYAECSFTAEGVGTFRGSAAAHPTIGHPGGPREAVAEARIELLCPSDRRRAVLAAVRAAHSYEEPAIDLIRVEATTTPTRGAGRIGTLSRSMDLGDFARRVEGILAAPATQFVGDATRIVRRVAICCGAGDDFLPDAHRAGADVLVTGEARFHRALEAQALGIGLIVAGHHATEWPGVADLVDPILAEFPALEVWASERDLDPLRLATPF